MSEIEYLDPDEVIRANHSPGLEAVRPKYTAEETPPPLLLEDTPESSAGSGGSGRRGRTSGKRRLGRTRPSQCDVVLINQTAPDYPEIAAYAGLHALDSGSQSGADDLESDEEDEDECDPEPMVGVKNGEFVPNDKATVAIAIEALRRHEPVRDIDMRDRPESPKDDDKETEDGSQQPQQDSRPSTAATEPPSPLPRGKFDLKPPPRLPPISTSTSMRSANSIGDEEDSIATSPALAKFAITQGNPDNVLPKMQNSPPPRTTSAHSPEVSGPTLPSLKTTLSQISETSSNGMVYHSATSGHSPSMTRPSPGQHMPGYGPSPASYTHPSPSTNGMSPPNMPTHRSYGSWPQPPTRDGSQSTATPSEYASNHSQSTPSSAITNPSPANSYSTPISAHQRQDSEGTPHANGNSPPTNGNGTSATNNFKCTYPGCTSVPFQTQYLLNSHANVHSSSRPHFCPVAGCNRGPSGKGFKRKNEMIRYVSVLAYNLHFEAHF